MNKNHLAALLLGTVLALPSAAQTQAPGPTGPDMLDKADRDIVDMKQTLKRVLGWVADARNENDIVKLNCMNEKLVQIKGLLKVAEQADIGLQEGVARRDPAAESEYEKVRIARSKVNQLGSESQACVGQLAYVVDEKTQVEVETPSGFPGGDPTNSAPPPPISVVRPACASPFQP
ncbi:MAG TPA: hypothetical protein VMT17_10070 [Anaeromyxobacteraceae bacterium]|nr:hypothetical protein [Anaeromyxobacteraceae bacterium]